MAVEQPRPVGVVGQDERRGPPPAAGARRGSRIQPDANAVDAGPNFRAHGDAVGRRRGDDQRPGPGFAFPFARTSPTGVVGGSATPLSRYAAVTFSTAPCV